MKFSIRDLLWLILLAAVATGWWIDHSRLTASMVSEDAFSSIGNVRVEYIEDLDIIVRSGPTNSRPTTASTPTTQHGPSIQEFMNALQKSRKSK